MGFEEHHRVQMLEAVLEEAMTLHLDLRKYKKKEKKKAAVKKYFLRFTEFSSSRDEAFSYVEKAVEKIRDQEGLVSRIVLDDIDEIKQEALQEIESKYS